MSEQVINDLYSKYPEIINILPETFTSHQFILELARRYQTLYIEALYEYRNRSYREGRPAPFMMVHGILAKHLTALPNLIVEISSSVPSKDIFGQDNSASKWRKL